MCSTVDTLKLQTTISDVTVFFNGAQITRGGDLPVAPGKHFILVEGLPLELNPQSIQVSQISNCQILSVKHLVKTNKNISDNKEITEIEKQIKTKELRLKEINNQISVYEQEENLLIDNSILGSTEKATTVAEIKEAADFYRLRLNEIKKSKLSLENEFEQIKEEIQKLYAKTNEIKSKLSRPYSVVLIAIDCTVQSKANIKFTYYTPSAGWDPLYDFRVEDITKPLTIVYNAEVYQSTGEDWKNVNIRLSTSNPSLSGTKPELENWYIERGQPVVSQDKYTGNGTGTLSGSVYDSQTGEPLPFVNISVYKDGEMVNGSYSDFEGLFNIKPLQVGFYNVEASYVGYNSNNISNVRISSNNTTFQDFNLYPNAVLLSEVYVMDNKVMSTKEESRNRPGKADEKYAYDGDLGAGGLYSPQETEKAKRQIVTTDYMSSSLSTPVVNLEYIIGIPYSIPADGQNYSMTIKEVSLPVNYIYHAVPKLDEDAFLSAEIPDWSELNLLSGKAGIYYNGTFTGESYIDVNTVSDTLNISLGRDNSIVVKRIGNKELNDKKLIGSTVKQTVAWDITVKNNKNANIKIFVYDQFPISERKTIEVERLEWSGAKVEEKTGMITWELEIEPNGKKELKTVYSVKYPEDEYISVE